MEDRELTFEVLKGIAPKGKDEILRNVVMYEDEMIKAGIVGIRKQYFLAQLAHESDGFKTTEEYASGAAYEGRKDLGNDEIGDGRKYKGRGLIQLTGKDNYIRYGNKLGVDLLNYPETAARFPVAILTAIKFWVDKGLNGLSDKQDFESVTRKINGGLNGLKSRYMYLERIQEAGIGQDTYE